LAIATSYQLEFSLVAGCMTRRYAWSS